MSNEAEISNLYHIKRVNHILLNLAMILMERAQKHDSSKLREPEKTGFEAATMKLKNFEYGSPEYTKSLEELKPTLEHHYRINSHHPEHYERGIDDMDLMDIVEMYADWQAAGERQKGGNIFKSINHNKDRFKMTDQLAQILKNTAERFPQYADEDQK